MNTMVLPMHKTHQSFYGKLPGSFAPGPYRGFVNGPYWQTSAPFYLPGKTFLATPLSTAPIASASSLGGAGLLAQCPRATRGRQASVSPVYARHHRTQRETAQVTVCHYEVTFQLTLRNNYSQPHKKRHWCLVKSRVWRVSNDQIDL